MNRFAGQKKEGDFDIVGILKTGWDKRKFIFKTVVFFAILGLLIALLSPKEFKATTTFMPQIEGNTGRGQLGGLASLAGINLGSTSTSVEILPSLYPKILQSVNFKRELIHTPITLKDGTSTTYAGYYVEYHRPGILAGIKKYTIGLPGVIRRAFQTTKSPKTDKVVSQVEGNLLNLTSEEVRHFSRIESQVEVNYNSKDKTVELSFSMPEPLMAGEMTKATEDLLQEKVISFRIQNAREQLNFAELQFSEKREEFLKKQGELANFRDRNQNIVSAVARNELQRLEAEYNFAFNLYTEMAKQLEQSRLQVSKDTPIFSVLDPVVVPKSKSSPNRSLIIILFIFLGVAAAIAILFIQHFLKDLQREFALKDAKIE